MLSGSMTTRCVVIVRACREIQLPGLAAMVLLASLSGGRTTGKLTGKKESRDLCDPRCYNAPPVFVLVKSSLYSVISKVEPRVQSSSVSSVASATADHTAAARRHSARLGSRHSRVRARGLDAIVSNASHRGSNAIATGVPRAQQQRSRRPAASSKCAARCAQAAEGRFPRLG